MPTFSRKCPACAEGLGVTQGVITAPGRPNVLLIVMVCGSCGHEWTAEDVQVPDPKPPRGKRPIH
jgi:C4-type Zn-finger protein